MLRLQKYSYRFAEQVLNSKLSLKQEMESILTNSSIDISSLSRPYFNELLRKLFVAKGWEDQPPVFNEPNDPSAKMDFLKERIGVEVGFGHASFIGIDLLKFQVASYSGLDKIDVGVYVVTTHTFQTKMKSQSEY
ncbi:restriction endonuclease [Candidatus Bathyarchaeota archaeon]|nr:restriction endonuclease [Candidatus Bathyarchaeota archaeon]